jgi:hypothetical protein
MQPDRIEWWPAPREGEIVPDHGPVDLTPYIVSGSFLGEWLEDADQAMAAYVSRLAVAESAMIEQATEMALQGGTCGVRVWRYEGGVAVQVDPTVPYGHVYEMPHGQRPPWPDDPDPDHDEAWRQA